MSKIVCIGETLYDIVFKDGQPIAGKPGGSVLNACVTLGKLGCKPVFISKVGEDELGNLILSFLQKNQVDISKMNVVKDNTSLAIAVLNEDNNAQYSFYKSEVENKFSTNIGFKEDDYFLFGSSFALEDHNLSYISDILLEANNAKSIILYDPNYRRVNQQGILRIKVEEYFSKATIVRASNEDFQNIFNIDNHLSAYEKVDERGCNILIYTCGNSGLWLCTPQLKKFFEIPVIDTVSTIGAGDNFNAGILYFLYKKKININKINVLTEEFWIDLIKTSIEFSADVCKSYDNYISDELAMKYTL